MSNSNLPKTNTDWKTLEEFIEYLERTLIPDLKESGYHGIAADLEDCVSWIKFLVDHTGELL